MNQKELSQHLNAYWKQHNIFQKSLDQRSEKFQSITYDGPPFASGTPHFGHGLVGTMKDTILRYKTMKGYKVNRDRGRDCHGLPVEKFVEKLLGIDGKKDIEDKIGVEKFVEECRKSVSNTSDERRTFGDQIGRRADMDHAYYTMDLDFMESVIWVFQNIYQQNLVYKGFNVQWMCPSCATSLSNSEVNDGYKDRQDPAITIKFAIQKGKQSNNQEHEITTDGLIRTAKAIIKDEQGRYLTLFDARRDFWTLPGGKIDKGEDAETALRREIKEEIACEIRTCKSLGARKIIGQKDVITEYFEVEIIGTPSIQETQKHTEMKYVEIIDADNTLGFALKIDDIIIDDTYELATRFVAFHTIKNVLPHMQTYKEMGDADISFLAWTTTPWTLPSNMFLAVGNDITYVLVFDKNSKEYYILAENLIKNFYKKAEEYLLINTIKGKDLVGITYEPLFQHINKSNIEQIYKDQFFKIIPGAFVSTEDGTGIVHIAPSFGVDDFEVVAQILPREKAKDRLFLPVNDYGEFTDEVPERKGIRVYDTNKDIIQRLKEEGKLIGQRSYEHSYPHCWRCDTPLISKALSSRFIKEPALTDITVPNAEKIDFVPEGVKKRFIDVLKSAPDRNLARNRYRGAPLPIWENSTNPEDIIVAGTLEEIYQNTKTGSQNITKNILIRHGRSDYNEQHHQDSLGKAILSDIGDQQSKKLAEQLTELTKDDTTKHLYISPLQRCLLTAMPYLTTVYNAQQIAAIQTAYADAQHIYQQLWTDKTIIAYLQDPNTKKTFEIGPNIYVDFRLAEHIIHEVQNQDFDCSLIRSIPMDQKLFPNAESLNQLQTRVSSFVNEVNQQHKSECVIIISHGESLNMIKYTFKNFDYITRSPEKYLHNTDVDIYNAEVRYRDNTRNKEVDLHKPYVDSYRFKKGDQEYHRIPEVMDCRFESGSMPFGQAGYIGENKTRPGKKPFVYPADFIMEGLDQTRGRFRGMHVCGNAVMKKNSFNNVIINGLVLAEDGKKMSKKLNNYPDPEVLFGKYGADAYRLYLLSSPGVRAEPVKFSEKGVEQVYKDFTASILNAYKFFETYAKVDNWSTDNTTIYSMTETTDVQPHLEHILRTNPDIIYTTHTQNAQDVQQIMHTYRNKTIEIKQRENNYQQLIQQEAGKTVLIISDAKTNQTLWKTLYQADVSCEAGEIIPLPTTAISNELDRRIFAELHNLGVQLEQEMDTYILDNGAKLVLGFIEKLNNRYIRRSRRRFRASGMDDDKRSAFNTLFTVLQSYMKICASFTPFVSEDIFLKLQTFVNNEHRKESIHLEHLPIYSAKYIDKTLLEEISIVRRIISLGLFIRSKNKIAVKQPLAKMQIKI